MARLKRTSKVVVLAQQRLASLATIDPKLDLGNSLTLATYNEAVARAQAALDAYNSALAAADAANNTFTEIEKQLATHTDRMLLGVALRYGKDSNEYEVAGGTRPSERKRRTSKAPIAL